MNDEKIRQESDLKTSKYRCVFFIRTKVDLNIVFLFMSLTSMNVGVFFHVRFLVESFAAKFARKWSGVAMNQKMCRKRTRSFKCFITLFTLKINQIHEINEINLIKVF